MENSILKGIKMTLFELVKITLDEIYKRAESLYKAETDAEIIKRFKYLSDSYTHLSNPNRVPIDYRDPATRFAYVYKYVATHGDYIVQLLKKTANVLGGSAFPKGVVRVSCLGGGPGSDILATLKYISDHKENENVETLKVFSLDKEQSWADTWDDLVDKFEAECKLHAVFQQLDVLSPDWVSQRNFLDADVYTLSYFVSEVYKLDGPNLATGFWQRLFQEAKPGALFLYCDNGTDQLNSYFDNECRMGGLKVLESGNNERWTPRYQERADVLNTYKAKFLTSTKLNGFISYRILRKPS